MTALAGCILFRYSEQALVEEQLLVRGPYDVRALAAITATETVWNCKGFRLAWGLC